MNSRNEIVADGLLTVADAAKYLAIGKTSVYRMMELGQLPFVKLLSGRRVPKRAVVQLAEENLTGGWACSSCGPALAS